MVLFQDQALVLVFPIGTSQSEPNFVFACKHGHTGVGLCLCYQYCWDRVSWLFHTPTLRPISASSRVGSVYVAALTTTTVILSSLPFSLAKIARASAASSSTALAAKAVMPEIRGRHHCANKVKIEAIRGWAVPLFRQDIQLDLATYRCIVLHEYMSRFRCSWVSE